MKSVEKIGATPPLKNNFLDFYEKTLEIVTEKCYNIKSKNKMDETANLQLKE